MKERCTMNYVKASFPVPCETGVYADAATGRRLLFNQDSGTYHPADGKQPKYVRKRTLRSYHTAVFDADERLLIYQVFRASSINKHGLDWEPVFSAALRPEDTAPAWQYGQQDLRFWLEGQGKTLLTPSLLMPAREIDPTWCLQTWWKFSKAYVCQAPTMEAFVLHWLNGTVKDTAHNTLQDAMKEQAFGVEIEFTGMPREKAASILSDYFHTPYRYQGGTYKTFTATDSHGRFWKIMRDGSINPQTRRNIRYPGDNDDLKCELVTPVLSYDDIPTLQAIIRLLRKQGKMVINESCGIHVHVDASGHTANSLRNLTNIMASHEDLLFRALGVGSREYLWCQKVQPDFVAKINRLRPQSMEILENMWYNGPSGRNAHYHPSRYHALNLHSLWNKKGIEFRMFNSTSHAGKVKAYIQLCLAISALAKVQSRTCCKSRASSDDLSRMRRWLVQLGLTGEEFATARLHLTSLLKEARHTAGSEAA